MTVSQALQAVSGLNDQLEQFMEEGAGKRMFRAAATVPLTLEERALLRDNRL